MGEESNAPPSTPTGGIIRNNFRIYSLLMFVIDLGCTCWVTAPKLARWTQ